MSIITLLAGFLVLPSAFANAPEGFQVRPGESFPQSLGNRHFFQAESSYGLLPKRQPLPKAGAENEDCRAHIRQVICLVEPTEGEERRECLPGGEKYAAPFEELHDHFPPVLQKVFCSLDALYIEKQFDGTGYAGTLPEIGVVMGVRQSVLDENLSLSRWASWKEQLSFGGLSDGYTWDPSLPWVEARTSLSDGGFLYFLVAHEFGHILDFANELNNPCENGQECARKAGTWGDIGWLTNKKPRPENDFHQRTALCFYWCEGKSINPALTPELYRELVLRTDFLSTYATTQPWDDFADSLAYFLLHEKLGASYQLHTGQGDSYDIMAKIESPVFARKRRFLEDFLQRTDIRYP